MTGTTVGAGAVACEATGGRRKAPGAPRWVGRVRRSALVGSCCAALVLGLAAVPLPATASREDLEAERERVADELGVSQDELADISAELVSATARLAELEAGLATAQEEEAAAEARAETARQNHAALADELVEAQALADLAEQRFEDLSAETEETERVVGGVAREVYQGNGFSTLTFIVQAEDPDHYTDMVVLAASAQRSQQRALDELQVQQAESRNAAALRDAERARVADLEEQAAEQVAAEESAVAAANDARARQESLVVEQVDTVAAVEAARAAEEQQIADLEARDASIEADLAQIAEQERAAAAAAAEQDQASGSAGAQPSTSTRDGFLSVPVDGRISSGYGYRIHPILGTRRLHGGTDFAAPCGTPVRAAADGTVLEASYGSSYGNYLIVTHGQVAGVSLATNYAHLQGFAVTSGAVSRGQVIGYVGTTGRSTGCHLHFETRENGTRVDPMTWL